jgi:hypothetical protein
MRRFVSVSLTLVVGLALLPGCSNSAKPGPAAVPANPVAIPKSGPTAGGVGGGAAKAPATQGANKTPVQ